MIDYDKLEKAHRLVSKIVNESKSIEIVTFESNFIAHKDGTPGEDYYLYIEGGEHDFDNIDDAIERLEGFTKEYPYKKLKNIFAFLSILFGDDPTMIQKLMEKSPDYLIEKWERYVESDSDEYLFGLHPALKTKYFDRYLGKWGVDCD